MIFSGIMTAASVVVIAAKFDRRFLKRMLGYEWAVDAGVTILFFLWGAMSGTFIGAMTGVVTGLCFSATLFAAKGIIGCEKRINGEWVEVPPTWTMKNAALLGYEIMNNHVERMVSEAKEAWATAKTQPAANDDTVDQSKTA